MSGWKYKEDSNGASAWFWVECTRAITDDVQFGQWFEVQQYVGPVQRLYVYPGKGDGHYRILTKPPKQRVVATASTLAKAQEFAQLACVEILPRVRGLTQDAFHQALPALIEQLANLSTLQLLRDWNVLEEDGIHTMDLAAIIEGIKCDSLMMSITFEYDYKYPPPADLLCATCKFPAVDPYVSPVFAGKVFCSSCAAFEGGSHFLKANNVSSTLDTLEVYCPFASFGCGVVVPRGALGDHLQSCPHVCIVCVNKHHGCTFAAKSKAEAIEHMQFCQYLPSICNDLTQSPHAPPLPPNSHSLPLPPRLRVGAVVNAANARAQEATQNTQTEHKCRMCGQEEEKELREKIECAYHAGTWSGHTYAQVLEWRAHVWRRRLNEGVKCVIHLPVEIAKSTTALGVGIVSVGALVASAVTTAGAALVPEMVVLAGGFLMVVPAPLASLVVSTVFSPTMLYNIFYKVPYYLLWGNGTKKEEPVAWTCCNKIGSGAEPCEKRGLHTF